MIDVDAAGQLGPGYALGASENLNAIACRYLAEAWVIGDHGTLLYTSDGGDSWESQNLGTTANLRALATQDAGHVFVAGDGVFFTAIPDADGAAQWTQHGDGLTSFRSVAAAQRAETVLAVSADGSVWSYSAGQLAKRATLPGARAVAVSPDGTRAIAAGAGLHVSRDGGQTWSPIASSDDIVYEAVRIDDTGTAVAVGANGTVARLDGENRLLKQNLGSATLRALHIRPADTEYSGNGYAAGDDGQIWKTTDGGWTWALGPKVGTAVLGVDEIGDGHN